MINRIIEYSAKNRLFIFLGTVILLAWAIWSIRNIPLDALPDLSDTQVIIISRWDRPPQIIEDQLTYPIVTALLGAPGVKDIRAFSDYGFSYVYVVFDEGTDVYWARSRVVEYLSKVTQQLPSDVNVEIGPDATGVGWVYEYALVDESGNHSLDELRTFQDWHLKFALQSVRGVSEVATIGGFVKQYQVVVDPDALAVYKISVRDVVKAVENSNQEVGARLLEVSGREYMITVKGYLNTLEDLGDVVLRVNSLGVPLRIKDVATVRFGPDIRRGVAELDGKGETVGGIVVMRYQSNALDVINRVKEKIKNVRLPERVKLVTTYDRSDLIVKAVNTLKWKLTEEMIVVSLVIFLFLLHIPSSMTPVFTLPAAVLLSFIPMYYFRVTSNVMSLGGIAIAIGAMVDASIVAVENSHKKLSSWIEEGGKGNYKNTILKALTEVGRSSFFSLLIISIAFLPIFTLESIEGRLFKPLAYTKNLAMFFAALLSITLVPALIMSFTRVEKFSFAPSWLAKFSNAVFTGKIRSEEKHPVSRFLYRVYAPAIDFVLKRPKAVIVSAVLIFIFTVPFLFKIGKEFMPPLNEGAILYMPTTPPGISIAQATALLQVQDKILKSFPEVERVFGKAGRALSATDPAPLSMMETTVILKSRDEWRAKKRWYSGIVPKPMSWPLRFIWPDRISWDELINEMDSKLKLPGQVNAWTMPVKGRIDMLTTGVRTPVGIKILGDDLSKVEEIGEKIEGYLSVIKGTRSVYAERSHGGYFIDFELKREEIARNGLSVMDVEMTLMAAVGGENVTEIVKGRERFPVNVRYPENYRNDIEKLKRIYVSTPKGTQIPVSQLADIVVKTGPGMIRDENGRLAGYVYVDITDRDIGSYVEEAKETLSKKLELPDGYTLVFSGQYEYMERVKKRMMMVIPLTLFIVFILLYINTKSYVKTFIVLLAVPFSLVGVVWILFLLDYNLSIGVWAGIIALLGVDAETGVFMLLYLDLSYDRMKSENAMNTTEDLKKSIHEGAVKRIRPKMMTVMTTFIGLLPIMWAQTGEIGADVMKRIAAPMIGGIFTSFLMELLVYPAIYFLWKKKALK